MIDSDGKQVIIDHNYYEGDREDPLVTMEAEIFAAEAEPSETGIQLAQTEASEYETGSGLV